jgi:hypothetical protein
MFEDGIKTGGAEDQIRVRDLAEIVAERIKTNHDSRDDATTQRKAF